MFPGKRQANSFASSIEQLGAAMLDDGDVKAVMMSLDEAGDITVTLVKGNEHDVSQKVRVGVIDRHQRRLNPKRSDRNLQ